MCMRRRGELGEGGECASSSAVSVCVLCARVCAWQGWAVGGCVIGRGGARESGRETGREQWARGKGTDMARRVEWRDNNLNAKWEIKAAKAHSRTPHAPVTKFNRTCPSLAPLKLVRAHLALMTHHDSKCRSSAAHRSAMPGCPQSSAAHPRCLGETRQPAPAPRPHPRRPPVRRSRSEPVAAHRKCLARSPAASPPKSRPGWYTAAATACVEGDPRRSRAQQPIA